MKKFRIHLVDTFSGCNDQRELNLTAEQLAKCIEAMHNKTGIREFKNNINYLFIITSIEEL